MEISYRLSSDPVYGNDTVFRMVLDENKVTYEVWVPHKKAWVFSQDACGAFVGFEPSVIITEQEAMETINRTDHIAK